MGCHELYSVLLKVLPPPKCFFVSCSPYIEQLLCQEKKYQQLKQLRGHLIDAPRELRWRVVRNIDTRLVVQAG
jgi:hypothetical protein